MAEKETPLTVVIFGGTGDLARNKLFSAFLDLYALNHLPDHFRIVGLSSHEFSHEEYREFVKNALLKKEKEHGEEVINAFVDHFYFKHGDLLNPKSYKELLSCLNELDEGIKVCPNRLFYLAVPPTLYDPIFEHVAGEGLCIQCVGGWTRLLVEKPFGKDLEAAQMLDEKLGKLYSEEQIFRIDHYIAKNTIQNILAFRFSNTLFEHSWNNKHIERVHIKLYENRGIEGRGSFYSGVGALRDVGQNHILQMLALVAMDAPKEFSAEELSKKREEVITALRPMDKKAAETDVLRAQYDGYKNIEGVSGEGSETETYFLLKAFVENERWKGVPFYCESGKGLGEDLLEIEIHFKHNESCMCGGEQENHQNILKLTLQPEKKVTVTLWVRKPGLSFDLEEQQLSFDFNTVQSDVTDAYEKVLFDALRGDKTLFVSTKEVSAAWEFVTSVLENWNDTPLYSYVKGSDGPKERKQFLKDK